MELQVQLNMLSEKIAQMKNQINTEEATKTAFVLPFINLLGYDIFNPMEVVPEFTADIGLKKGEKVDYAIFLEGEPILIIECKKWKEDLNIHNSQLFRYFHTTKTRFALLTNGIDYLFYTDLDAANKMDEKPFLEYNICNLKDSTINEIAKFQKVNFDIDKIVSSASSLKYMKEIKKALAAEFQEPSTEFVKYFANKVYSGRLTEKVLEQFKELVLKSSNQFIGDKVSDRLNNALNSETVKQKEDVLPIEEESKIDTTEEELEAYQIVVAIARRMVSKDRIVYRDTQSYFGILLDDNNRKPICRLHLNGGKKYISTFENKVENKNSIESIDDIYNFEKQLKDALSNYIKD